MTPVFIGETNPYSDRPYFALYDEPRGATGDRLRRLICGVHARRYREFPRYDLCVGKWSKVDALIRAREVQRTHPGAAFVLLGRKVATAFCLGAIPPFYWAANVHDGTTDTFIVLPHPSGLNRQWQEPGAFARARDLLREACPDVPWGEAGEAPAPPPASIGDRRATIKARLRGERGLP